MSQFRLPLSGDVNQTINPWTWNIPFSGNQFGWFNINLGKSTDPVLEQRLIENVGSYGRQLGRIGDVLSILVDKLDKDTLTEAEKQTIEAFKDQLRHIELIKKDAR